MATVAKSDAARLIAEGEVFEFGDDGTRQVSQAEVEKLQRYLANGGTASIEFTETKTKGKG